MCHRKGNGREWSGSIVGEEAKENVPVVSGKTKYAIMKNTLFHIWYIFHFTYILSVY